MVIKHFWPSNFCKDGYSYFWFNVWLFSRSARKTRPKFIFSKHFFYKLKITCCVFVTEQSMWTCFISLYHSHDIVKTAEEMWSLDYTNANLTPLKWTLRHIGTSCTPTIKIVSQNWWQFMSSSKKIDCF